MYISTDNIEVEVNEVELEGVDWIVMAKNRDKVLDFTNWKCNFRLHKICLWNYKSTRRFTTKCG